MRLPRIRFTVRTMMVSVVIVATILAFLIERRERFRRVALGHRMEQSKLIADLDLYLLLTASSGESLEHEAERFRAALPIEEYYYYLNKMIDKYECASSQPWLPVDSDPLPPSKPSKEYVTSIVTRYCRIPGEPDPPWAK